MRDMENIYNSLSPEENTDTKEMLSAEYLNLLQQTEISRDGKNKLPQNRFIENLTKDQLQTLIEIKKEVLENYKIAYKAFRQK